MYNEDFSKEDYLSGIFQGFWWAFISATTVGYVCFSNSYILRLYFLLSLINLFCARSENKYEGRHACEWIADLREGNQ